MATGIRRLRRREIDTERWDAAVEADPRSRPYGLSWWLDAVTAGSWEALVVDDYRAVLPLPWLRRYGVLRLLQRPPFSQQLGPYGRLEAGDLARLLDRLPRSWRLRFPLRAGLDPAEIPARFTVSLRTNLVLPLDAGYAELEQNFSANLRRDVRQHPDDRLSPLAPAELADLCRRWLGPAAGYGPRQLAVLTTLAEEVVARERGGCYALADAEGLLCAGLFPRSGGRTVNLCAVSTDRGRRERGMGRLLARMIRETAGPGRVFDFEGSDLPGVRAFFTKFRPVNEPYPVLR